MSKKVRIIIMALLLVIFCTMGGVIFFTHRKYEQEDKVYEQAAAEYTRRISEEGADAAAEPDPNRIPIEVDFEKLRQVNEDVVGWIYCEGTVIDYPVLQGDDNDYYLHHNFNRQYHGAGSIFADANNQRDFVDSNTILYGHHMKNGSMFASLDEWESQEYYEEHPVMWLLTPEQDYRIVLFSGYTTPATSDTYTTFDGPCTELMEYLEQCLGKSDFRADPSINGLEGLSINDKYVVLSTCDYTYQDARYVLHGKLVPVER